MGFSQAPSEEFPHGPSPQLEPINEERSSPEVRSPPIPEPVPTSRSKGKKRQLDGNVDDSIDEPLRKKKGVIEQPRNAKEPGAVDDTAQQAVDKRLKPRPKPRAKTITNGPGDQGASQQVQALNLSPSRDPVDVNTAASTIVPELSPNRRRSARVSARGNSTHSS